MTKTINRFGGRTRDRLPADPRPSVDRPYTVIGRSCCCCRQPKSIIGGRSRWAYLNNQRVSVFTCAGCVA